MNNNKYRRFIVRTIYFQFLFFLGCDIDIQDLEDDFLSYLTKEVWEVENVINRCNSENITKDFVDFSISFSEVKTNSNLDIVVINYITTNGSPAFSKNGNLTIMLNRINDNEIFATRNDSIIVKFDNLNSNVSGDVLEFDVKDVIECDSSQNIIQKRLVGSLRKGDISFRCRRRKRR